MSKDNRKHTLCWDCANATGLCAWSRSFEPVPGWTAEPTKIKNTSQHGDGRCTPSFRVIDCPEYVKG